MDLHVCIKIDDDAVDKIAKVITETVKRVAEIQQLGALQQSVTVAQPVTEQSKAVAPSVPQVAPYSAQIAQATQMPVQVMTGQPAVVQTSAPIQQPVQAQSVAPSQPTPIPTAAQAYTREDLSKAAMILMDRGMQAQLQDLLAGYGVASLPDLPPEQYGNFATALRGMGAPI